MVRSVGCSPVGHVVEEEYNIEREYDRVGVICMDSLIYHLADL